MRVSKLICFLVERWPRQVDAFARGVIRFAKLFGRVVWFVRTRILCDNPIDARLWTDSRGQKWVKTDRGWRKMTDRMSGKQIERRYKRERRKARARVAARRAVSGD